MLRSLRFAAALFAVSFAAGGLPGQPPSATQQRSAAGSGQAQPPWAGATELGGFGLWIGNPVPPLQALIQSRAVAELLESADLIALLPEIESTTPAALGRQLQAVESYIPVDLRIGAGGEWFQNTVRCLRILTAGLQIEAKVGEEAPRLRIGALLDELAPMPMIAQATFRDDRTAEQLFEGLAGILAEAPAGIEVQETGDVLRIQLNVGDLMSGTPIDRLAQAYARDEDEANRWLQALGGVDLLFECALDGAAISITTPGSSSGALVLPRELWGEGPEWARAPWLHTAWKVDAELAIELEDEYYALFDADDDDFTNLPGDFVDSLSSLVDELALVAARGEAIVHVGDGGLSTHIVETLDEFDLMDWDVEDGAILRLTNGDFAAGMAVPAMSLDLLLSSALSDLDGQLERRDRPGSTVEWFRWEAVTAMEDFIHGDDSTVFESGSAMVLDRGDPLGALVCNDTQWDAGAAAMPAFALVGRPIDDRSGRAFVHEFGRCLRPMLGAADPAAIGTGPTLRVGVEEIESWELPIAGSSLLPTAPVDSRPVHAAIHDGWLVISTATKLSERIFAALAGPDAPASADGQLASASWCTDLGPIAEDLMRLNDAVDGDAFGPFADAVGWSKGTRDNLETLRRALSTVALVLRPIEARHQAFLEGNELTQRWWIRPSDAGK